MLKHLFGQILLVLLICTTLQAQNENSQHGFAFRHITTNFELPLENYGFSDLDKFGKGLEFEYFHPINQSFDLSVPFYLLYADLPQNADGSNTKATGILGLDVLMNYNFYKGKVLRPRLFAGLGGQLKDLESIGLDVPLGLGLNFYVGKNTSFSTTFAYHISSDDFNNHVNFGIGFHLILDVEREIKDRDGDGVMDDKDECPDIPGSLALNGCPDKDNDGITDALDKCPETAGIAKFEGCPDTDNDGLKDSEDKCPEQAGPIDNEGCPITDRDGDGVNDDKDDCPDEKGTVANNGCPEKSLVIVAKDKITDEVLPNTMVTLLNSSGEIVKSGTTNSLGEFEFANLTSGDYSAQGKLYDVNLEPAQIGSGDFKSSEQVKKIIYYNDPNFIVQGKVFYCNSTKALTKVALHLRNKADNFSKTTVSDAAGQFMFHLSTRATYELFAKKESFLSQVVDVDVSKYSRNKSVFVKLELCAEEVECDKAIRLKNILYDNDKSFIRTDAKPDLNKVVQFMKDNAGAKVELSAHSDSKGRASYNLALSEKRARAAAEYIIAQGVSSSRIISKGYGETRLLNNCADGVKCSDAEHQLNRRTEFKLICPE